MTLRCPLHPDEPPFSDEGEFRKHLEDSLGRKWKVDTLLDVIEWNEGRKNKPPLAEVGEEKVTVACPYEPHKLYVERELLDALSALEINEHSEIFYTIDTEPAPIRWTSLGDSVSGHLRRRQHVCDAHNRCRKVALENNSDYLLMVEADLLPPPDSYRRLKTLCERYGAGIAFLPYTWHYVPPRSEGIIYRHHAKEPHVMAWRGNYPTMYPIFLKDLLLEPYPAQVSACGMGVTLVARSVFEKIPFEVDPASVWSTDGVLGGRAQKAGIKILGDNRLIVQHLCCLNCYMEWKRDQLGAKHIERLLGRSKAKSVVVEEV